MAGGRRQYRSAGQLEDWMASTGPGFSAPPFPVIGGAFQPLALDFSLKRMLVHLYSKSYSSAKLRLLKLFFHPPIEVSSLLWQCLRGVRDLKVRWTIWNYSGSGDNQNQDSGLAGSLAGMHPQQKPSLTDSLS